MITNIQNISQIFYYVAVGIGLLLAGIGAIIGSQSWKFNVKEKRIKELKLKYPKEKNGKTFQLIKSSAKPGYIYLLDNKTNIKHHVGSSSTFHALEYNSSMVKKLEPEKFSSLEEGYKILIEY